MSPLPPSPSLNEQLAAAMAGFGSSTALITIDEVISYKQLGARVITALGRLKALGISKGDHICYQLPNCANAIVLMLAALQMGAVPVPMLPTYRERELRHILKSVKPRIIAVTKGNRRFSPVEAVHKLISEESLDEALILIDGPTSNDYPECLDLNTFCLPISTSSTFELYPTSMQEEDIAVLLLSSGTTGLPKPIARRNGGYTYMINKSSEVFELDRSSVYLAVLSICHGFAINCPGILGTLVCGGAVVLAPNMQANTALELIATHGVTHTTLVPTILAQWISAADQPFARVKTLRHIQVGASKLSAELAAQAELNFNACIQQCYGMSEGLLCFTRSSDSKSVRFYSQGRPLSDRDEVVIVDAEGAPVAPGQVGELLTRGPYTIEAYFNDPLATYRSFTQEGYYRTGDLAQLDLEGNVYLKGRVTDSVNRGGEKFSPEELEGLCIGHAKIRDAACVGVADPRFGEVAYLFAVLHEGEDLSLPEIRRYLEAQGIAPFKLPERLFLLEEIPRKGIEKIDRALLREMASNSPCTQAMNRG